MRAKTAPENYWGLRAEYQQQPLVFSGTFSAGRLRREFWRQIWRRLRRRPPLPDADGSGPADAYRLFSHSARRAWTRAFVLAKKRRTAVGLADIFLALLDEPSVRLLFGRLGVDAEAAKILLKNYLRLDAAGDRDALLKLPFEAYALAVRLHDRKLGSLMLLGALLKLAPEQGILRAIFTNIGLTLDKLEVLTVWQIDLDYDFGEGSASQQLLDCCRLAGPLEQHFGYRFEFSALEAAVNATAGETDFSKRHKAVLALLVKAGLLAKQEKTKLILPKFIKTAAA